jgi:multiple sugar transport system permease protein
MMKAKQLRQTIIHHAVVVAIGIAMAYPLVWLVASSFKEKTEIFQYTTSLIPKVFTLENYRSGWAGFGNVSFAVYFRNSFIIAGLGTVGAVLSSLLVAYGFSRVRFMGRGLWFTCMLATLMLPFQVQMIPQYIMFRELDWINSFLPLIVPRFLADPFFVFLMMQFIRGLPVELDESAEIDGANRLGVLWWIIVPLVKPALITSAIFSFYWKWDDFLGPLLYLNKPTLHTVSLALRNFADPSAASNWGAVFAMSALSLVPVMVVFIAFQKYIVDGISTTGMTA